MSTRTSGEPKNLRSKKKAKGTDLTEQSEVRTSKGIFTALLISILLWVITIGFIFILSYSGGNSDISRKDSTIGEDQPVQSSLIIENSRLKSRKLFKN